MTGSSDRKDNARQRINSFVQNIEPEFQKGMLYLAYHAALPVALDANLVHLLRINFFFDSPEPLPNTAESDLLLSSLCYEVDDGLYEIESDVRDELLSGLAHEPRFGPDRVGEIAVLLWQYTERYSPWIDRPLLERAQQLTALNFLDPEKAMRWLEEAEKAPGQFGPERREWFVAMRQEIAKEIAASISEKKVKKPVVLHLSDLQFGPHHVFEDDQKALDKLKEDIDRYEQEGIPHPNIVVVSGDLADTGGAKGDEHGAVTRFLESLCQHLSIDRRYVVLVPGNHDVNWDEARKLEALKKQGDSRGLTDAIREFFPRQKSEPAGSYAGVNYLQRFGKYAEFYNRFYRQGDGTTHYTCDLSSEAGFNIIYDFHSKWRIAFLTLNSCEKEDHHDENHYGYISPSVLRPALEEMEAMIATPCVKVAVFHHNALAGGGEDRLRNFHSEILPALSQAGFSLVLHGHTHKPDVDDLGPELTEGARVRVVGAGSISVARAQRPGSDREGQVPNQYWVLAFELGEYRGQFTAYARQYDPILVGKHTQGKWIPYNLFTVAGKSTDRRTFEIDTI